MIRKTLHILSEDGPLVLRRRASRFARRRLARGREIGLPVATRDLLDADWETHKPVNRPAHSAPPEQLTVNWVIPPIANGSGGHHTILRFVRALEARGHTCNIVVYDGREIQSAEEARAVIRRHFPEMKANIWTNRDKLSACDALIATAWQTAYPVFNAVTSAKKFYFVQDYEPLFFPVGTESVLAENTYKFGLHGITAGRWLSHKLTTEFGMSCDHFEFGSDSGRYRLTNADARRRILFYARPGAPRRGFELGVFALTLFAKNNPDYEIHLLGSDVGDYRLPFEFTSHGVLKADELNQLYNEAAAALVISLTNMSLLPLELLSAGCIPVVNDGENNRLVSDNPYIAYADPSPRSLAMRLQQTVRREDLPTYARAAAESVRMLSWEASALEFERILFRRLRENGGDEAIGPHKHGRGSTA